MKATPRGSVGFACTPDLAGRADYWTQTEGGSPGEPPSVYSGLMDGTAPISTQAALHQRWETPIRYYTLVVQRNLFGQWELVRAWGGRGTRLGAVRVDPAASFDEASSLMDAESLRRQRRGYRPTGSSELPQASGHGSPAQATS